MTDNPYEHASSADARRLRELGQPLVDALTAYRGAHGVYPASLAAAGIPPIDTPAGPFQYRVVQGGRRASLYIGDYQQRLFRIRWSSEIGWYLDE
ncbi:MAG TPA: hypothetical protein VHC19_23945 [Pirellulales bacterium]|jgi:hypothetical protein|nr:hypothetical protein [Pirellulales bacterium]